MTPLGTFGTVTPVVRLSGPSEIGGRLPVMPPAKALGHQCHACRRPWALQMFDHPAGPVVLCRYCFTVRASARAISDPDVARDGLGASPHPRPWTDPRGGHAA